MPVVVLPLDMAAAYGAQIEAVAPGEGLELAPVGEPVPELLGAEILLHGFWYTPPRIEDVLAAMPDLRWVHSTGAGLDDLVAAGVAERNVRVTNVAGAYAPAMAEYCIAAMVMLSRGFRMWIEAQRKRAWLDRLAPSGAALHGKQLGIVGYGSVGRHLAVAAKALGMTVWATRRTPGFVSAEPLDRLLPAAGLDELLAASDVVAVAAGLNSSTRRLLDADAFAAAKPGVLLVNVARGGLVDHEALLDALDSGRVAGAALDVTDPEPLPADSPLWDRPNVLITPHISGDTAEGWQRGIDLFCTNLRLYLSGSERLMANQVDLTAER